MKSIAVFQIVQRSFNKQDFTQHLSQQSIFYTNQPSPNYLNRNRDFTLDYAILIDLINRTGYNRFL